jgi:hypothetical protein
MRRAAADVHVGLFIQRPARLAKHRSAVRSWGAQLNDESAVASAKFRRIVARSLHCSSQRWPDAQIQHGLRCLVCGRGRAPRACGGTGSGQPRPRGVRFSCRQVTRPSPRPAGDRPPLALRAAPVRFRVFTANTFMVKRSRRAVRGISSYNVRHEASALWGMVSSRSERGRGMHKSPSVQRRSSLA